MSNEWITDRLPTEEDANNDYVYDCRGKIVLLNNICVGELWKPIPRCEPYVKPKRFMVTVVQGYQVNYSVWENDYDGGVLATRIPTRQAAERIAAIYEEVMP